MSTTLPVASSTPAGVIAGRMIAATNAFGFRLYELLADKDAQHNLFLSSASLALASALVYNGAGAGTRQAIAQAFGWQEMSSTQVNTIVLHLYRALVTRDPEVTFRSALALLARVDFTFRPEFLQQNKAGYRADVGNLPFIDLASTGMLNSWVKQRTDNAVTDIVAPGDLDGDTLAVLLNAVHLEGKWTVPFDIMETEYGAFTLPDGTHKSIPLMTRSGVFPFFQTTGFRLIQLPLASQQLSLVFVLPDANASLADFRRRLSVSNWDAWMDGCKPTPGRVRIPRFRAEYAGDLAPALGKLGLRVLFSASEAELSGICYGEMPMYFRRCKQHTLLRLNEDGMDPATARAYTQTLGAGAGQPFDFHVNRPFFLALRDRNGAILCLGNIGNPQ